MKKTVFVMCLGCAAMMLSCGHETEKMKITNDSLASVNLEQQAVLEDLTETLVEVSASLDSIAIGEGMLKRGGEGRKLTRQEIMANISSFKQMLAENREKLDKMQKMLSQRDDKIGKLSALITHLTNELDEREATIAQLQGVISDQKTTIEDLTATVEKDKATIGEMEEQNVQQREQLSKQDMELNAVYYVVGSSKELKGKGLLKGGFLKKNKADFSKVDISLFTKADKRQLTEIAIPSKSAKVMSGQPENAYEIVAKDKQSCTLRITNKDRFWSAANLLIIEAK